ncbi:anthocyanin 3'-O-beta-glucosyltransferase, partial [Trifolium medium]|nr:anthocyanin 3'-O-beta-glucosyltransferase [Trifolium medium]
MILVWHAVVWTIWTSRNEIIFAGGSSTIDTIVDKVKLSSWKWFLGRNTDSPCSLYEWEVQTRLCWSSKARWGCGAWLFQVLVECYPLGCSPLAGSS